MSIAADREVPGPEEDGGVPAEARADELLEAAELADLVTAGEHEARYRLRAAGLVSVAALPGAALLAFLHRDEATASDLVSLVVLVAVVLVGAWTQWWFFVSGELAEYRARAAANRILGGGGGAREAKLPPATDLDPPT